MRERIGLAVLFLLVAGCGSKEPPEPAAARGGDAPVIASVGGGAGELRRDGMKLGDMTISTNPESASCVRPDYVPLPPGAKVTGCMAMGKSGQVMFEAATPPAEAIAFYKAAAIRAGLTDTVVEQGAVYSAIGKDGRSLVATASGNGNEVAVMWGMSAS